ncbi:response regulator transcription factor [bacterium]|nr:response regulator transcription factor [bacterium]
MPQTHITNILLIDDHTVLLEGMSVFLNNHDSYNVCGAAKSAKEGLEKLESCKPDLVILDVSLNDGNGLDVLKQIKINSPATPVIMLSMHDEMLYAERAVRAGASGYIMKGESLHTLFDAIPIALNGGMYVSDAVRCNMIGAAPVSDGDEANNPLSLLSDRELEIFLLMGKGKRQSMIADQLHISARTVETHARRICSKLNLNGMKELAEYAIAYSAK